MRFPINAALLAAFSLVPFPAAADEEIVVTATRAATAPERLPTRVEVIDRAEIEQRGLATVSEAIGSDAVQSGGAGQQTSVFLRGANSKHVLALFDGVRLNDAAAPNAQYDFGIDTLGGLERIEVLLGPASTIYGSDAVGGVVNMIPRRGGGDAFAPFIEAAVGSFETRRALVGVEGTTRGWNYGVSADVFRTDGFDHVPDRIATATGDPDGAGIDTFIASVRREQGAFGFDGVARLRRSEAEYDTFSGGPGFDLRADDPDLENEAEQTLWRLGGDWHASELLTLRLSGGQVLSDRRERDGGVQTTSAESARAFADATATYRSGPALLTGGISFERNEIDTAPQFADPLSADEDQAAIYLISQVDVGDHVVFTGSARADDYENFGVHTTYALGAVGRFQRLRLFASHATAFKAPSLSERFETSFFNIGNPDLRPEQSRSWEIGADWSAADWLRFGGSYYQTRIDNLIEYDFALSQNINVGEAEIDGAEAYAEAAPASWSSLRLSYAWTDARDADTGAQLARRPEDAWRLDAQIAPTQHLTLTLTWLYVGERTDVIYADDGSFDFLSSSADDFHVGALAANFALTPHADLFARIDNITDETYEQPNAYAGAPRNGTIGVRARF